MINPDEWLLGQKNSLIPFAKWQNTVNLMTKLFQAPAGFIVQHTPLGYQVTISSEQQENPYGEGVEIGPDVNIFCRRIVETGSGLYVNNATELEEWQSNPEVSDDGFNSYMGMPINWPGGQPFGTICVMDYQITDYDETLKELIGQFRDMIQGDLLLVHQYLELQQQANSDELTGLLNRRGFMSTADQRLLMAERDGAQLLLAFIDMDGLKHFNDKLGHAEGDSALRYIGAQLQQSFEQLGICARVGGDEFLLLTDQNQRQRLLDCCQKIDQHLQSQLELAGISVGIIDLVSDHKKSLCEWISQADSAMYQQKMLSRSRQQSA